MKSTIPIEGDLKLCLHWGSFIRPLGNVYSCICFESWSIILYLYLWL